jgi:hypothetical protein
MKRRVRRRQRQAAQPLSRTERRSTWANYLAQVTTPTVSDLERLVELSSGWSAPEIATSVGLAVAYRLLGNAEPDQRTLEELILRDNHTDAPEHVSKSILHHAAVHEAGHAIWGAHAWGPKGISAVALVGPPPSLGQTLVADSVWALPKDRRQRRRLVGMALAGAVAEQVVFGPDHPAIGAEYDIKQAWSELSQRGVPRSDRGEAGFAARWAEVEAVIAARFDTIVELGGRLLDEPSHLVMGSELQTILSADFDSEPAAA